MPNLMSSVANPDAKSLISRMKQGHRHAQTYPPGSAAAWLLADLATHAKQLVLILTADPLQAQRLAHEIGLVNPSLRVRMLPDWETLPYDGFSPHQDLISERLRTLHALQLNEVDVLTVPITTALYSLATPSFLAATPFLSNKKTNLMRPLCVISWC